MAVKVKDATLYIKKHLFFFIESTYRLACGHPFVASFVFSLFLLHSCYPSLFFLLVSSSPVLICTALLLGILLCYGDPYIPEIEVEDELSWKVSSLKVENTLDDLFIKKDKSYKSEGYVDSGFGTKEMTYRDLATDGKNEMVGDFLVVSSSVEEQNKTEEDYIWEHGFVENMGELMKEQSECHVRMSEVADEGNEGVEGLIMAIKRPEIDECLDSSLGSPWQHINIHDAASDSESDQAESSSTDASMTDILPMLNELHPLLNSKTPKSANNSDEELSSEDSAEQEDEHRIEESNASNEVVTWTADDKRNVMDLGSSDLERNRRLESLIAKRRARKNQIIIYEKDLIDLHGNDTRVDELFRFHPQIPHISAPRRNPFDLHHELEESEGYTFIPGSAPSVLVHQENPFSFQCEDENGSKGLAGDNLCQTQFGLPSRRGLSFRSYESFSSRSLFPSNVLPEIHGSSSSSGSSRLKHCFVGEAMSLDINEYVDSDTMTSSLDPNPQKELAKQEICEDTDLPVHIHASKTTVQDGEFCRNDFVNFEAELIDDGHFVDPNASAVTEETRRSLDASVIFKDELERTQIVSNTMLDGQKHEVDEENDEDWTLFTSSEDKEKNLHMSLHEALETQGQTKYSLEGTSDSVQSSDVYASIIFCETKRTDNSQAAVPVYDSSPSGSGNFIANIYVQDDALLSSGGGGPSSTFMEFHDQEDVSEEVSHAREFDENMTAEMMELEMVHGNKLHNSTYSSGEPVTFSTYINVLNEDILTTKDFSETEAQDVIENRSPGIDEDLGDLATSLEIDHSSCFSSGKVDMNDTGVAFSPGLPELVKKCRSLEKLEMQTSFRTRKFELKPILEENSEDFIVKEEILNLRTFSTGPQVFEEPNVCKPNVGHKIISLHGQTKEAAGDDEGNEGAITFSPGKAKSPKAFNLVSADDEHLSRLLVGGFLDSTEFLDLYKMKSEYEFTSNGAINDSQVSNINEFHVNQGVISRNLNEFYTEPGDVDAEDSEIQCFDEIFLSELDAVGDFHVEVFESQQCLRTEAQSTDKVDCSIGDSELGAANIADTSPNKLNSANPNSPHEIDSILNPKNTADSGFWSLSMAPVDDLELTVYKSKFNVLQACALEELDFSFKQDSPGEFAEPSLSETITDNFVEEKPHVGLCRFDMCDQEIEDIPYSSGLTSYISAINGAEASLTESVISSRDLERGENDSELVVEAKMIEDSDSAFKHASEMVISNSITPSVNPKPMITHPLDNVVEIISHEVEKTSGLLFLEAKSVEDINSFFEAATKEVPAMPVFCSSDLDSARTHADSEEVELSSPDAETSSELFVLEAKSAEDIQLAFKESIEGVSMMPSSSLVDPNLIKATQGLEVVESMCGDINDDSKLLVLEGKSSKDIDSVFKQFDFEKMITHSNVKVEDDDNAENDTKRVSLGKKLIAVTSAFQEAIDQDSDKSTFHQDVYSLNAISAEDINLNSTLEQDNEDSPAHSSSQDGPELGYVHPSHEDVEKESLRAEDKSEIYSLESKTFEVAHLDFKEASTDYFCPNQEQVVLDEKSPDFGNTSNFFVTETKSLEDDEVYDVKESSFAADNSSELIAVEGKSFVTIHSALSEDTNAVCEVSSSLSADPKPMKTPPARKGDNMCTEAENNSDILLIEAKSFEDIVSAFKLATIAPPSPQPTDAMALHSERASSLVLHEEGSTIPIFSIDPPYDEFMEENSLRNKDSKLLVLEEISVKDIDSALEQVSGKYHGRSVTLEDDSKLKTRELQHKDSELFIVEQISVSDSDVIVKQDTEEGNKETATSKTEDGSTSDETVIRTSEKKMDKRTDEEEILSAEKEEIVTENPGFSAPISLKMEKKEKKYEKSDSSSSSSSSSSDTE